MKTAEERFKKERTRIISEMFNNVDDYGIYPTTKCFQELDIAAEEYHQQKLAERMPEL